MNQPIDIDIDNILSSLNDGILIIDRDYTIIYANEKVVELCGNPKDEILGKKCHLVFHGSPSPCAQNAIAQTKPCAHQVVFTQRQSLAMKHHHLMPDGSTKIFEIAAAPLRDKDGTVYRFIQVLRDITVQEKLREELAVSHHTLETIFTNVPFVISFIDKEMRVIRLNPAMEALVRIKAEEAGGRHCYDCFGQYAHDASRCGREKICDACQVPITLFDGKRRSHERMVGDRIFEVITSPVRDAGGAIIGAMEVGYDITERHEARLALRESENHYRVLFESSPNVLCIADFSGIVEGLAEIALAGSVPYETFFRDNPRELAACLSRLRISHVNQAALNLFGATSQQELIDGLFTVIGAETVPQTAGGVCAIGRGESSFEDEIVLYHLQTGARIYCVLRWNVVPGFEESYQRVILSLTDISARKIVEDKLVDHRAHLWKLSARLVEAEEAERRLIARELHDKLGQSLTVLGVNLHILRQEYPPGQKSEQGKRIDDSLGLIEEMTEKVRNIMADLRPPMLDDYGLGAALRWYGGIFGKRFGIPCLVQGAEIPRLPVPVEMMLFRVVQEALNNVAKHSGASRVDIRSALTGGRLTLAVQDNGKGMPEAVDADRPETLKLGFVSMGERVESVGGTLAVTSAPGAGTVVSVEVGI